MKINADFFKTTRKTAEKQLFQALDKAKKLVRENRLMNDGARLAGALYRRLIVRGEYTRRDLAILFIAAVLLGMAFKAVAAGIVTIGFEDYTLAPQETLYDLNAMQQTLIQRGGVSVSDGVSAGACSE